jgi:hypothetical protein
MKQTLITLLLLTAAAGASAQQYDDEYKMEIGGGIGLVSYLGDFNDGLFSNSQPVGTVVLKRVLNPYMALAAQFSYGKLKGTSKGLTTYYPDVQQAVYDFSNAMFDLGVRYEYNFWPYGTGRDYRGAKRLTPFVFGGLGGTLVSTSGKSVVTVNAPIGVGVKYKVAKRLNLSVEWAMHFTNSDRLDGVADPYYIKSSGVFKNSDCYSMLQVSLTFSFLPKCVTCNNDIDD